MYLPSIWHTVAPLKKARSRSEMEAACQLKTGGLRFCFPIISHSIVVVVLAFAFHTKDPYGVGETVNTFLFLDLYPAAGSEAALLTWQ